MRTQIAMFSMILILFAQCADAQEEAAAKSLAGLMIFGGNAEGDDVGWHITCVCSLNLELTQSEELENGKVQYEGTLGGDISRIKENDAGDGFALSPFLFGEVTVTVHPNDSVFVYWPGNEGTGIRFYDAITLFKGRFNAKGDVEGFWRCMPLDLDGSDGGYTDMDGIVEGTWTLSEPE